MWFGDILDDHDSTMGYDPEEPFKADDTKMFSFKVKSGVSGASLSTGQDVVQDGKGGYQFKHKTELKSKMTDELEGKLVTSNKEHEIDLEWKPTDLNKDGQVVELELDAKCQPIPNKWSGEVELKAGGFDLGPIKPWTNLKFETNDKGAHAITYAQNLVYENDFHAAWKLEFDKNFALGPAYGVLAMIGANGNYYFRSTCRDYFMGVGTWFKNDSGSHSVELQYDAKKNNVGMFGQPLFLRYGGKYKFGAVSYSPTLLWGQRLTVKDKTGFAVGSNTKLTFTSVYDVLDVLTKAETANVKVGVACEFKI